MFEYIKGKIEEIESGYIVLDNNGLGYQIFTASPYSFEIGKEYKVFVYEQIREDENTLYGFKTKEEKEMFLKLIDVKGLGPKMAIPMLSDGSINGIIDAIERENILYLKKILDLKGKLVSKEDSIMQKDDELTDALKALGYKPADIKRVLPKIDNSLDIENKIKQALKLLLQ